MSSSVAGAAAWVFLAGTSHASPPARPWHVLSNADGVLVLSRDVPGSRLVAFRGETLVPAGMARVAAVLADAPRHVEWISRLRESRILRESSPTDRVEYNHTAAPWPTRDRDFVIRSEASWDAATETLTIRMRSVQDPLQPPRPGIIRADLKESLFTLRPKHGGRSTFVTVEIQADPKGLVPAWVVNLVQKGWPRQTLLGLRRQAAKPDVGEHPGVKDLVRQDGPASVGL